MHLLSHDRLRSPTARLRGGLRWLILLWLVSAAQVHAAGEQMLTGEKMAAALQQYVLEKGPWKPSDVEVRISGFKPLALPPGPVKLRVLRPVKGVTPGTHSFFVAADVGGKEEAKTWVRAEVRVYADVVVSSAPLAHHEPVSSKDVRLERRDITSLSGRPLTRVADAVGKQAARAIEVNEIFVQSAVERPTLMRRGTMVVLLYETGSLRVETPGIAEEPGRVGDMIQVKNPTSGKLMRGIVLDGRTVRVN